MPCHKYCEQLLEAENAQLGQAQDALDDYNEALDEMGAAAEEAMGSAAKSGGHALSGDWGDAWGDIIDTVDARDDFRRASEKADRALEKWEREEDQRADAFRQWCEECGDPPEVEVYEGDPAALPIEFDESEVQPIIGHPGGRGW
jgi:hypothetical protein